ncbi:MULTISPECIES: sn-glycerol-3-phosphate ABC transporter permease UgpE [unclassified Acidovorax]|jgi:sn-glycerol 3-phosphate transport system permease protein|uniref:sn-glycerol-3-phosphate ABC transporter permease UgpE n=1 Tax=unclassified Acidovorax TaxID=2684926 RepID=UPI000465CABF|nr:MULTISPECIES: sn-glycerol-3-phosphate ABC transporter permease UgpE [unclassified Acidovorax]MCL5742221.1 sn-glycerol-3-phosphate ABC transporter permease UgpE [Betaproteobacteria bacterium]OYX12771.1 MAG: glycerol-3-phosphate transporter [Acidovorax sp. 32-64-7]OZA56662.1 MAG: glycerol-3-phosphate transporter [Acidovorax sp. 17-64-282]HQS22420.1 sn-glycerol-3-phosphate ABC transporter permease UgpE [Acidovorax defluvii]MBP7439049.1 sn-glycerol-3-phosphate ABC transporter permease UgpE [Aci
MVDRSPWLTVLSHAVMILGVMVVAFPLYLALVASTHTAADIVQAPMPLLPGGEMWANYKAALFGSGKLGSNTNVVHMMWVSFVTAIIITVGKIAISLLSAFAIVYFRFPFKMLCFWAIFLTLMLPVEVRILPTYKVVADLGLLNTYGGLTLPLIASATATFLFRQFFLTVPDELVEAARMDGAGPMRFFKDVLVPLSKTSIAALFVIQFIYGWNQYLWPLLMTTTEDMYPVVIGIKRMVGGGGEASIDWNIAMATAILAMLPPAAVVILMQKWFVKGLVDTEK